jgi:hypothetical protein
MYYDNRTKDILENCIALPMKGKLLKTTWNQLPKNMEKEKSCPNLLSSTLYASSVIIGVLKLLEMTK